MKIFTTPRVNEGASPGRGGSANLWRQWVRNPKVVRWLLHDGDVLRPEEVGTVQDWAGEQLAWGLHVRLHTGAAGLPQVVEVLGPDLEVPHVLLYRVGDEIQVDEADGGSRRCADIAGALEHVARCS